MQVLGLPGRNPATFEWLTALLGAINFGDANITVQRYECWSAPGSELDLALEARRATETGPELIVAKSIGTTVALALDLASIAATKLVFIGVPLHMYTASEMETLNNLFNQGLLLIIQQTSDPAGSANDIRSVVSRPELIAEVPGNDHDYFDLEILKSAIEDWIASGA